MLWLDENDALLKHLLKSGQLGLMHSFNKESNVKVTAFFKDLNNEILEDFKNGPVYIDALDLS